MYRNGSTVKFSTAVIGDTSGQCGGAKFIPYYNNNQGNAAVLMCSSFSFPGGDTLFFRFKIDPLTSSITPVGAPLVFHSENSFALFSSQPETVTNDVYFLLNSYPAAAWNNYSIGVLNLVDFQFEMWPVVRPSESPFFLDARVGTFSNAAKVDQLLFSAACGPHDSSYTPETMCTFKYSSTKEFVLLGMNPIPNARSYRNLYLYAPGEQQWGVTITSDSTNSPILVMNTQFSAPTNASRDVIYGATLNDTNVILTFTIAANISPLRDRCFYLATASSRTNELAIQQLKFGEDFKKTPTVIVDSTVVSDVTSNSKPAIFYTTKNHLFVSEQLNIYRFVVEC